MDRAQLHRLVSRVESMVSPRDVGRLHQRAESLARLPVAMQDWVITRFGGRDADMAFVVEPYAVFLAYEITDRGAAEALLPSGHRLLPTAMFAGTAARPTVILGAFTVHTSVFWGVRLEVSIISEDERTGMLTWVICDHESNTISHDPGRGFSPPTTSRAVATTTHAGEVLIDIAGRDGRNELAAVAPLAGAAMRPLDERLWVEGNMSVAHGGALAAPDAPAFGLVFDPAEVAQALAIEPGALEVERNTVAASWRAAEPYEVACFPYAQHYVTSSFPRDGVARDRASLLAAARDLASG